MTELKMEYIDGTSNPEKLIEVAARMCYDETGDVSFLCKQPLNTAFIDRLMKVEHESPFEHACFTFGVEGISRTLLAQLTRHRIGWSFSVRSQRFINHKDFNYIIPELIKKYPELTEKFQKIMTFLNDEYILLSAELVKRLENEQPEKKKAELQKFAQEEARYILPNAAETKLIMTMNVRSAWNFLSKRLCNKAQREIRDFAWELLRQLMIKSPLLFSYAGPPCAIDHCKEGSRSCKLMEEVKQRFDSLKSISE